MVDVLINSGLASEMCLRVKSSRKIRSNIVNHKLLTKSRSIPTSCYGRVVFHIESRWKLLYDLYR